VAVESSSLAYSISLDLLHIVVHLNVKKNTFYIADYLRFPGLNFGAIFSLTRYVVNAGLRGNGIHMMYATYIVYVVQKCSLYGRLNDGFVRTWKSTLRKQIGYFLLFVTDFRLEKVDLEKNIRNCHL
jgi:hypothetical protein